MTWQRDQGTGDKCKVWYNKSVVNSTGEEVLIYDEASSVVLDCVASSGRNARSKLPGQHEIEVFTLIVDFDVRIEEFGVIFWQGEWWDIAAPPQRRFGATRHVRHTTVPIRLRSTKPTGLVEPW